MCVGQEATFKVLSYPGEQFNGKIVRVGNEIERESRTLEARIEVDNGEGRLKPGMFADVEITTDVLRDALIISYAVFCLKKKKQIVLGAMDTKKIEKRDGQLGLQHHMQVQNTAG